jgi:hypothetical protein
MSGREGNARSIAERHRRDSPVSLHHAATAFGTRLSRLWLDDGEIVTPASMQRADGQQRGSDGGDGQGGS